MANDASSQSVDVDLLARCAGGERAAFAALYDRFAPRLFGLIVRLVGNRAEAEDVLQETFLAVWRRASSFDGRRASPAAWLILLARSRAVDHMRRRRRRSPDGAPFEHAPTETGLLDAATAGEEAALACAALKQLPPEQQHAISLSFFGGLSHQEIASSQKLALGTVKTRIRLGMQRLRELLNAGQRASA